MDVAPADESRPLWRRPTTWLVVVAVAHGLYPLIVLGVHWAFGPDETIYLSQLNGRVPPAYFSAPRARGSTLIAAPVTLLTSSVAAVRLWVTALSGLGLWLAFRPWLRVVRGWVVPVAAAAFASLWTVTLYGFEVMPNEWVAFATLGACGAMLRWFADGRHRHLLTMAFALAVVGLLRPSDAAYATLGLAMSGLLVRAPWRARVRAVAALVAGTLAGIAEWVIEAEVNFGGVVSRIHAAQAEQGGGGLYWAGGAQARVLAGPLLCRGTCRVQANVFYQLWWPVLGVLVLAAVIGVLARRRARSVVLVPAVTGAVVAAQYLFTVPYGAPRFLIPAYALLAVPAVLGAREIVQAFPRLPVRRLAAAGLAVGLALSALVQLRVLTQLLKPQTYASARQVSAQADALADIGVRRDCLLFGTTSNSLPLSYALGCVDGPYSATRVRAVIRSGHQVVWLRRTEPARSHGDFWHEVSLPDFRHNTWVGSDHPAPAEAATG